MPSVSPRSLGLRPVLLRAMLVAGMALGSCGSSCGVYRISDAQREIAELRVVAEPASASVYINERFLASAKKLDGRPASLRPGKKRVTIEASGYFPHDVEVDLPVGRTTIEIKLRPIPR